MQVLTKSHFNIHLHASEKVKKLNFLTFTTEIGTDPFATENGSDVLGLKMYAPDGSSGSGTW